MNAICLLHLSGEIPIPLAVGNLMAVGFKPR
jgi:hypothetical protein